VSAVTAGANPETRTISTKSATDDDLDSLLDRIAELRGAGATKSVPTMSTADTIARLDALRKEAGLAPTIEPEPKPVPTPRTSFRTDPFANHPIHASRTPIIGGMKLCVAPGCGRLLDPNGPGWCSPEHRPPTARTFVRPDMQFVDLDEQLEHAEAVQAKAKAALDEAERNLADVRARVNAWDAANPA
jgi:hypothetical protein